MWMEIWAIPLWNLDLGAYTNTHTPKCLQAANNFVNNMDHEMGILFLCRFWTTMLTHEVFCATL